MGVMTREEAVGVYTDLFCKSEIPPQPSLGIPQVGSLVHANHTW